MRILILVSVILFSSISYASDYVNINNVIIQKQTVAMFVLSNDSITVFFKDNGNYNIPCHSKEEAIKEFERLKCLLGPTIQIKKD